MCHGALLCTHIFIYALIIYVPSSTTAQFNLGKLLLHQDRPAQQGGLPKMSRVERATDVREAKGLLLRVLREKKGHPGANLCLARILVQEGGVC